MTEVSFAKTFLSTLDNKTTKYQPDHIFDPSTFAVRVPFVLPKLSHPHHPAPPRPQNDLSTVSQPPPGAEPAKTTTNTINITLKSTRNPSMTLALPSTPPSTTIASLKQQVHNYLGGSAVVASVDKIKILHNKKPIPASKEIVADIAGTDTKDMELGVMVMGGAPDPLPQDSTTTSVTARAPEAAGPGSENAAVEAETGVNPTDETNAANVMQGVEPTSSAGEAESQPIQPGEEAGAAVLQSPEFWSDLEGFLAQRIRDQKEATRLRGVFEQAWRSNIAAP